MFLSLSLLTNHSTTILTTLKIKNLALVENLTWDLGPGLISVTGETGAGKSMIIGALKLILGERTDRNLIRRGAEQCTVEAIFSISPQNPIHQHIQTFGLEPCENNLLLLKRTFTANGNNKQFINCSSATLTALKTLGNHLVDLHGPHDHQSLFSQEHQLHVLDQYAHINEEMTQYTKAYQAWRQLEKELQEVVDAEETSAHQLELLRHQLQEIDSANIELEKEQETLERYHRASNSRHLLQTVHQLLLILCEGEAPLLDRLAETKRYLDELTQLDPSITASLGDFDSLFLEFQEIETTLRHYQTDLDPSELAQLEERINIWETLKQKYGGTLEEVLLSRQQIAQKLDAYENKEETIAQLEARIQKTRQKVDTCSKKISHKRTTHAPKLSQEIAHHLIDLGFRQSHFEIKLLPLQKPNPQGAEEVEFYFAPNPGEPQQPLRHSASSGEISRIMLALKSALSQQDAIPLLVFDEIDANVGGEIATAVGRKMASLGQDHQVIAITHLPQVAASAQQQFVVSKKVVAKRTHSILIEVSQEERVNELARMLGGTSASALKHARTLLNTSAEKVKN